MLFSPQIGFLHSAVVVPLTSSNCCPIGNCVHGYFYWVGPFTAGWTHFILDPTVSWYKMFVPCYPNTPVLRLPVVLFCFSQLRTYGMHFVPKTLPNLLLHSLISLSRPLTAFKWASSMRLSVLQMINCCSGASHFTHRMPRPLNLRSVWYTSDEVLAGQPAISRTPWHMTMSTFSRNSGVRWSMSVVCIWNTSSGYTYWSNMFNNLITT